MLRPQRAFVVSLLFAGLLLSCHALSARETIPTGLPVPMHVDELWELLVEVKRKATLKRSASEPRVSPTFIKRVLIHGYRDLRTVRTGTTENLASRNESRLIPLTDCKRLHAADAARHNA